MISDDHIVDRVTADFVGPLLGGDVDGCRIAALLQQRQSLRLEIVVPIVERQDHRSLGKILRIESVDRVGQAQHRATETTQGIEPAGERARRDVQGWIPLVLVGERDAVVAQDHEATAPPGGIAETTGDTRGIREGEQRGFQRGDLHGAPPEQVMYLSERVLKQRRAARSA
jgi:hypothetical protein